MRDLLLYSAVAATAWSLVVLGQAVTAAASAAKVSEPVLLAIVGGVVTIVTTVFGGIMTYFLAKIQRQGVAAAVQVEEVGKKAEEVKTVLEASTVAASKQLTSIHTLVNANMGAQLTISAVALRRIAELTKHPDDLAAAVTAEGLLADHMKKQAVVDSKQ